PIRPDMHAALAWFCGLIFLEAARSREWEIRRLFLGGFFIAYASALHYWVLAAALVLPAYCIYILIRTAGSQPLPKLLAMAAGALAFYVPWAIFFVIPDFHAIVKTLKGVNATGEGSFTAIRNHFIQLQGWVLPWPRELPFIGKM